MCMKKFTTIFLLLYTNTAFCTEVNNWIQQLKTTKDNAYKIDLLDSIQDYYLDKDNDSALYFNHQAELLINKLKAEDKRYSLYHSYVRIYHAKFDNQAALKYCLKALDVAQKQNNKKDQANAYQALFSLYGNVNEPDSAVKYGAYALKLSEEMVDTVNIATLYGNLAKLYHNLDMYDKQVEYAKKGFELGKRYNDYKGTLISLNNLGLGYIELDKTTDAIDVFKQLFTLGKKYKRIRSVSLALQNLGTIYNNIGDVDNLHRTALDMQSMESEFDTLDLVGTCTRHLIYGQDYTYRLQYKQAEDELLIALKLAQQIPSQALEQQVYESLSDVKYLQHDFISNTSYSRKADSIDRIQTQQELAEDYIKFEKKYETEKKESQIKLQQTQLQQKNIINYVLIASIFALLSILFLIYRIYRNRQKLQEQRISELETEKQLQATDAILKIQEEERSRIAKDLHDGLGGLLSGVKYSLNNMKENVILSSENALSFERTVDMLDSGIQELRRVAHNMMPENLVKFGLDTALKDYCSSITKTNALQINYSSFGMGNYNADMNVSVTVYRVIQELINNTMKHAKATESIVQISNENQLLHITVEDNGKGFDVKNISNFKGAGWSNIQNRIAYLKGIINIDSNEKNGTSVIIEIPFA